MAERLFIQDDFRGPFTTKDFIERLTQKQVASARNSEKAFEPRALIALIEASINDLLQLDDSLENRLSELEGDVSQAEEEYKSTLSRLDQSLSSTATSFERLEERIRNVATTAVLIGDQLETMNLKRERAAEARELMKYFDQLCTDQSAPPSLTDPNVMHSAANALQKLNFMASELTDEAFDWPKQRIQKLCDDVEKSLLSKFSAAYSEGELGTMKMCANTLYCFKGFTQCVDVFINQHPFFSDALQSTLSSAELFEEILTVCKRESRLILEVFYSPKAVMHRFLERMYEQGLHNYVENRLQQAKEESLLLYLETLHGLYRDCQELQQQLLQLELCNEPGLLHKLTDSVFCLHLPEDVYITNELAWLRFNYEEQLEGFYESIKHTRKDQTQAGLLDRFDAVFDHMLQSEQPETGVDQLLNAELSLTFIYDNKSSLSRCLELSPPDRAADHCRQIFSLLLDYLCEQHMEYSLDIALQCAPPPDPKREPPLRMFPIIYRTNYIFHVLQNYYAATVAEALSSSFAVQSHSTEHKNRMMLRLQTKAERLLHKGTACAIGWIDRLLESEQTRKDFFPPDDNDISIFSLPHSDACGHVVSFLKEVQEAVCKSLDGMNKVAYVVDFSICFQLCLLAHIKRFFISSTGALLLSRDINTYVNVIKTFGVPSAVQVFDVIKDLCNVYMVRADNIKQIVADSHLMAMDPPALVSLLERRSDWKQCRKDVLAALDMS